jgi:hypothetical protein
VARRDAAMPHGIAPNRLPPARQGGASE